LGKKTEKYLKTVNILENSGKFSDMNNRKPQHGKCRKLYLEYL
jgi:hypothetical protein